MADQKQEQRQPRKVAKVVTEESGGGNNNLTKLVVVLGGVILILIIIRFFILGNTPSTGSLRNLPPVDQAKVQVDQQFGNTDFDGDFVIDIPDVSQEEFVEIVEQLKSEKNLESYNIQPSGEMLRRWQFDALNPGVVDDAKNPPIEGGPEDLNDQ